MECYKKKCLKNVSPAGLDLEGNKKYKKYCNDCRRAYNYHLKAKQAKTITNLTPPTV